MGQDPGLGRGLIRGEVYWCSLPEPDKRRPVIIVTRDSVLPFLQRVTVVPITGTVRATPSYVRLGIEDGLFEECAANLDGIQTVLKELIGEYIARLTAARMNEVAAAARFAFALTS